MRQTLVDLINKTIIFQYELPNKSLGIPKSVHSSESDHCYFPSNSSDLSCVIYNGIVDYSYNESHIDLSALSRLHRRALITKIRYDASADPATKKKYGLFGEILLFLLLKVKFGADTLISRGYFYNPLEGSETKGYDTYQLIQKPNERTELWFGEVKFYESYKTAIKKIFDNIDNAISSEYLDKNIVAMSDRGEFNVAGSEIEEIVKAWEENPGIIISKELKNRNMALVYPILLVFDDRNKGYNDIIDEVVTHINTDYPKRNYSIDINVKIFFILLPVKNVGTIKDTVIKWIDSNQPLI